MLPIDPLHKSVDAPVPYPTMHHFATEMCTFLYMCTFLLQNGALWDITLMRCGIYEMDLLYELKNDVIQSNPVISRAVNSRKSVSRACTLDPKF